MRKHTIMHTRIQNKKTKTLIIGTLVMVPIILAAISIQTTYRSSAAGVATVEAESGVLSGNAVVENNTNASGGKMVRFVANATNTPIPTNTTTPPTNTPIPQSPTNTPVPPPPGGNVINVSTSAQLATAMANAVSGDVITLANGSYAGTKMTGKNGTSVKPIVIRAATRGGAVIASGQLAFASSSYVTVEGLKFTTTSTIVLENSNNIRLTRNHFRLTDSNGLDWVVLKGNTSHHNRIDHNLFEEKKQIGNFIAIDGNYTDAVSQDDMIDHNYFKNVGLNTTYDMATNEMEAIRVGLSQISNKESRTIIEYNLFENCNGDPEVISLKAHKNIVRYNTFKGSLGGLVARHGNGSKLYGNFFLGENKTGKDTTGKAVGTGGIRLYGSDHEIFNNYFENLTGTSHQAALSLDGGDVDQSGALNAHWRVYRAKVVNNTFVNNVANIHIGEHYTYAPVASVVANNIVKASSGDTIKQYKTSDTAFSSNILSAVATGLSATQLAGTKVADAGLVQSGIWRLASTSTAINGSQQNYAALTDDIDGQARNGALDIGADEYSTAAVTRRTLTTTDVGINAN